MQLSPATPRCCLCVGGAGLGRCAEQTRVRGAAGACVSQVRTNLTSALRSSEPCHRLGNNLLTLLPFSAPLRGSHALQCCGCVHSCSCTELLSYPRRRLAKASFLQSGSLRLTTQWQGGQQSSLYHFYTFLSRDVSFGILYCSGRCPISVK